MPGAQRATAGQSASSGALEWSLGSAVEAWPIVYGAIVVVLGMRAIIAELRVWGWRRRAEVVVDPNWRALYAAERARFDVAAIPLLRSAAIDTAIVAGLWQPVLIIPSCADSWSSSQRRAVLAHELAHVVQGDPWALRVAAWVQVVYCFNPLIPVWVRRWRSDCEFAADARAAGQYTRGSDYAGALLGSSRPGRDASIDLFVTTCVQASKDLAGMPDIEAEAVVHGR